MFKAHVKRTHQGFFFPPALPHGDTLVSMYGFLIERGEDLDIEQFARRIEAHFDNPRVRIEAGEIRRWYVLMQHASETVVERGRLPESFDWEDGTYDASDIAKILGDDSLKTLSAMT